MLAPVRTAAPAQPVVTVDRAKVHLRIDHTDDDTVIEALIQTGTDHLDGWNGILGRALVNQTWRQDFDRFSSCDPMRLPLVPVLSAPTVTYYDDDNAEQTLPDTVWQLLTDAQGPFLVLKPDQSWPSSYSRADAVSVTFVAGYGAAGADVPVAIQVAVLTHVAMNYDPSSRETLQPLYKALVDPYVRFKL